MSDLLTPDQLGERWGKSRQALANMRFRGDGPAFVKIGARTVMYRVEDVLAYETAQIRHRTDEDPKAVA